MSRVTLLDSGLRDTHRRSIRGGPIQYEILNIQLTKANIQQTSTSSKLSNMNICFVFDIYFLCYGFDANFIVSMSFMIALCPCSSVAFYHINLTFARILQLFNCS